LDDFKNSNNDLLNNNNILLGDAGYDSNIIREKLIAIKFGKLLTAKNKRNTKNKIKLKSIKLLPEEKKLLKKKIKIERLIKNQKFFINPTIEEKSNIFLLLNIQMHI